MTPINSLSVNSISLVAFVYVNTFRANDCQDGPAFETEIDYEVWDDEGGYFVKAYEVLNNYVKRGKRQDIIGWMPKHEALVKELDELSEFVLDRNYVNLFEITEKEL